MFFENELTSWWLYVGLSWSTRVGVACLLTEAGGAACNEGHDAGSGVVG
jgi:hypothetical protein